MTDPRILVYVSFVQSVSSLFSLSRRTNAMRRNIPNLVFIHDLKKERERERKKKKESRKKRSARKAADGNISTNPRAHTFFSWKFQPAHRILCGNLRAEMEKTLIRGAAPTRQSGHAIIRDARAQRYGSPDSRYGTKCPRTAWAHPTQRMFALQSFVIREWYGRPRDEGENICDADTRQRLCFSRFLQMSSRVRKVPSFSPMFYLAYYLTQFSDAQKYFSVQNIIS